MKALLPNTGWTLNPSPTQCLGVAGKICLTERSNTVMVVVDVRARVMGKRAIAVVI